MTEQNTDNILDQLGQNLPPEVDSEIRKSHLLQAQAEFSQAFAESPRPSDTTAEKSAPVTHTLRRFMMSLIQDKMAYSAFGTLALGVVAVSLVLNLTPDRRETLQVEVARKVDSAKAATGETANPSHQTPEIVPQIMRNRDLNPSIVAREVSDDSSEAATPRTQIDSVVQTHTNEKRTQSERQVAKLKKSEESELSERVSRETKRMREEALRKEQAEFSRTQSLNGFGLTAEAVPLPAPEHANSDSHQTEIEQSYVAPMARPDSDEEYAEYQPNPIVQVAEQPVSTFSVDVDTASYSLVRNQLGMGLLPNPQAVRAEEMINYFDYDYPLPESRSAPFEPSVTVLDSPWNEGRKLVHIGIQGYELAPDAQPDSNLVFLLDVSGSMNQPNKLPLVKQSLGLLLDSLKPTDTIAIAVYAGAAGTVLEPTPVRDKQTILGALNRLSAGGSTAGGQGLRLAYSLAEQHFSKDAVNRIILATDGDFNVGQSSTEELKTLVERQRDKGIFLSVLGFGRNNYKDDMMQTLAQNGNGVAAFIDTLSEARKVLVDEASSTLFTIAKDVKLQVEFNPATVSDYRLVGYETRALQREDFNNDKVDAGDIGAGHSVTAIYEITPSDTQNPTVDPLRYDQAESAEPQTNKANQEYGFLKIRYKLPNESTSRLIEQPILNRTNEANSETGFAVAVAGFAQLLRGSPHTGSLSYESVIEQALQHRGDDRYGYRSEFIQLVRQANIAQP